MNRLSMVDPFAERHQRHIAAAMLATLVSFVIHLAVMCAVADLRLAASAAAARAGIPEKARPPLRVERLPDDPLRAGGEPERGAREEGAGTGVPRERIGELARLPDPALTTPPPIARDALAGTLVSLLAPPRQPLAFGWQPRQQIVAVLDRQVKDELATLPRREIPRVERIPRAPDFVPSVDVTRDRFGSPLAPRLPPGAPSVEDDRADIDKDAVTLPRTAVEEPFLDLPAATPAASADRFGDPSGTGTGFAALDDRLGARVEVFVEGGREGRVYFRLLVGRRDNARLPVAPKDFLLVQDCSRSLAEERLFFCRQAWQEVLATLKPDDRFNVARFSDQTRFCFDDWSPATPEARARAADFIAAMRADGETDIFGAMRALLALPRDPRRPVIALVVTDGRPTAGLTAATRIIGEFTKLNAGAVSVFALGTHGNANAYLLDLLTYCNRGASTVVASGRWDIPAAIRAMAAAVADPVLGNVAVSTDIAAQADLHPLPSANLYAGRLLEYHGSCPAGVTNLTVQVRGEAGGTKCDALFRLDLANAPRGSRALRDAWARHRMHSLIGAYARRPSDTLLAEIERHSRKCGLPIPYRKELRADMP
jgi:hypothetical protein